MKKARVSSFKHQIYNNNASRSMSFLCEDQLVEVHMQGIDKVDAMYEMVVYHITETAKTIQAFFLDDPNQAIHTVSFIEIAPIRGPLRNTVFQKGQPIEARYRVDENSQWGWWAGTIHEVIRDDCITHYDVKFDDGEIIRFEKHLIRKQSFI